VVAIEFAIVGLIFFTLLLGAVDLARYQFVKQSLGSMAQEAARTALLAASTSAVQGGGCGTLPANLPGAVTTPVNPTPILVPARLTLTAGCTTDPASNGARIITVVARYPFDFVVPFLSAAPMTATARLSY
jgi:type II secretory pathway pseudopilin PulG